MTVKAALKQAFVTILAGANVIVFVYSYRVRQNGDANRLGVIAHAAETPAGAAAPQIVAQPHVPPSSAKAEPRTIVFGAARSTLTSHGKETLQEYFNRMSADGRLRIRIVGYAPGNLDASKSGELAIARARASADYLAGFGIDPTRIVVQGFVWRRPDGAPVPPTADRVEITELRTDRP